MVVESYTNTKPPNYQDFQDIINNIEKPETIGDLTNSNLNV